MRTDSFEALGRSLDQSIVRTNILNDELDICHEEKRVLSFDLDRCKEGLRAAIEQREALAAKLREAKR